MRKHVCASDQGTLPSSPVTDEQPELDELEEILQPEQIVSHKDRPLRHGKVQRKFLVKFKNYPIRDAKWMEASDLADSLPILNAYLDAFQLRTTVI